jgi:hypothetical protein
MNANAVAAILFDNRFINPHCGAGRWTDPRAFCEFVWILLSTGLLAGCLAGSGQKGARILLRVSGAEDGVSGYQQLRSCLDDLGDGIVSHSAIHLDFKRQTHFLAQFGEVTEFF